MPVSGDVFSRGINAVNLIITILLMVLLSSCEREDPVPEPPSIPLPSLQTGTYVLSYNTFTSPDDVVIASVDSTYIEASIDYLVSRDADLSRGDVIVVWRAENEVPFIRRIIDKKNTGTYLRLKTEDADVSSVFRDADVVLSTVLKIFNDNPFLPPYERYSNDNVCHPAVIITHYPDGSQSAVTAEKLIAENPNWNILTSDMNVSMDTTFYIDGVKFDFNRTSATTNIGVNISLTVQNTLLRRFQCTSSGVSNIFANHTYECLGAVNTSHKTVFTTPVSYTLVFWAGEVPLAIDVNQESIVNIDFKSDAPLKFSSSVAFDSEYNIGSTYRSGWHPVKDISLRFQSDISDVAVTQAVNAQVVILAMNASSVNIFNDFYSGITVGYELLSTWKENNTEEGESQVVANGEFEFGGQVDNSDRILYWNIPAWNAPFNVVSTHLWTNTYEIP